MLVQKQLHAGIMLVHKHTVCYCVTGINHCLSTLFTENFVQQMYFIQPIKYIKFREKF